jgi:hypothetical protein
MIMDICGGCEKCIFTFDGHNWIHTHSEDPHCPDGQVAYPDRS